MSIFLNDDEYQLIVEGLEALKSKDFGSKVMKMMMHSMFDSKVENMSPEDRKKYELQKEKEQIEEEQEKEEKKELSRKVDILKGKILMIQEDSRKQIKA